MASEGRQGGGGSACSSSSSSRQPSQATHIHMHMHRHAYTSYPAPVAAARLFCTCPPAPTKCPAPIGLGTMCVFNSSLSQTQQGRPIRHCTQQGAPQARRKKTGFFFFGFGKSMFSTRVLCLPVCQHNCDSENADCVACAVKVASLCGHIPPNSCPGF